MSTVWKLIALGFALCLKQAYSYKITPLRKHVVFSDVNYNVASQIHRYEGYSQRRFLSTEKHNSKRFRLRKSSLAVKANSMDDGRCSDSENALLGSGLVVLAGIVGFFLLKTLMQSILPFAIVVGTLAIVDEVVSTKTNQTGMPKFRYSGRSRIASTQEASSKTSESAESNEAVEELRKFLHSSNTEKKHYATRVQNAISRMQQQLTAQSEDMAQLHSRIQQTQERVHHLESSATSKSVAEQQTKDAISETLQQMECRKAAGKRRSSILSRINGITT